MSESPLEEIPAYCGLDEADLERRREQGRDMMRRAEDVEALEDGYRFTFPGDLETLEQVLAFTKEERQCCPMATFTVRFGGADDPVTLAFRGPDGLKDDMRRGMELERWFDEVPT
jgi:hypothetical protein